MSNRVSSSGPGYFGLQAAEHVGESSSAKKTSRPRQAPADDLNLLQKRRVGSEDSLNLHAIWTSVSRYAPASSSRQSYREKMAEAYVTASYAANRASKNVNASLWTDMDKNLSALLRPVVRANGSELEIPHSMIARSRLQVHPQNDIPDMIKGVEDPALRLMLTKIYHHPLSENVGARSDLLRHLCGMLDKGKLNVYMDIDDLTKALTSEVLMLKHYRHLSFDDVTAMSPFDRSKLLITAIGSELLHKRMLTKTIVVPAKVLSQGHLTFQSENSTQGQVPRHKQGERVAQYMLMAMDSGVYTGKRLFNKLRTKAGEYRKSESWGYEAPLKFISGMTKLAAVAPNVQANKGIYADYIAKLGQITETDHLSANRTLIDHFRFAESLRQSQGEIQHDINGLVDSITHGNLSPAEKEHAQGQIAARHLMFSQCMQLIEATVNVSTYLSQVGSHAKDKAHGRDSQFNTLFWQVAGNYPYVDTTDSWKGKLQINCDIPERAYEVTQPAMAEAFAAIRGRVLERMNGGYQVS